MALRVGEMVAVANAGSSSLKFSLYVQADSGLQLTLRGVLEGLGTAPQLTVRDAQGQRIAEHRWSAGEVMSHDAALQQAIEVVRGLRSDLAVKAVGHRVVHGGLAHAAPVLVTPQVLDELSALAPLAPLHQPSNLAAIRLAFELMPGVPQVACFDTAFHRSQRELVQMFALPHALHEAGVRRYGFHGLSYEYIASCLPRVAPTLAQGRVIVMHLGNGASACAMQGGRSVDSTMGFTALDGLMMGTRTGALDPGVLLYLMDERGMDARALERLLYRESGLLGVSGVSSDMRTLLASDEPRARVAVDLFVHRIVCEVGALAAAMGGVDGIVFTAGIGEHAPEIRRRVALGCAWLGVVFDESANAAGDAGRGEGWCLSTPDSRCAAWVIPTDEEGVIARHTAALLGAG